ncbi:hypothetical protein EX30DRAFT_364913 [Ascodesmis nigricans]|uniref:PIN domain-containing protein n=1 Tax=Ascodesmis nigricans TaxID=341454 RepID=A0A4S2MTN1_9PEZI|nr:hypothetical protein EX30DRAFT_364913 [Ascodesmis nigricans]
MDPLCVNAQCPLLDSEQKAQYNEEARKFTMHPNLEKRIANDEETRKAMEMRRDMPNTVVVSKRQISNNTNDQMVKAVFVIDTNMLVMHLTTIDWLMRNGWGIVIPNDGSYGGTQQPQIQRSNARAAEYAISNAIAKHSNMKICTAQGNNVSRWTAMREKLPTDENRDSDSNTDDDILVTTKKVREKRNIELGPPQAAEESAILLTENIQLRVEATVNGVVALNTNMLMKYLLQWRNKQMSKDPAFAAKVAKEKEEQEKKIMQDGKRA